MFTIPVIKVARESENPIRIVINMYLCNEHARDQATDPSIPCYSNKHRPRISAAFGTKKINKRRGRH